MAAVALAGFRWPAMAAGWAAFGTALAGALLWPGLGVEGLAGALVGGIGTSAEVLYVLFGGLLLYNVLSSGGAVERVSAFLARLEPEREAMAVVVVVGVGPFFESVTGFGVAVVISAPILLAAGFPPLKAAVLASWGQCAVPWGALGVGTVIGADLSNLSFGRLSDASALLNLPLFPIYGIAAVILAGGSSVLRRRGLEAVGLGAVAGIGTLLTSVYLVPELSGAIGGLSATVVFLALRWRRLTSSGSPTTALIPYAFLLALLALANGVPRIKQALENLGPVFAGPGLMLLLSSAFAGLLLGIPGHALGSATRKTLRQWLPTAGAVLAFVLAGQVVASSGAAGILADGAKGIGGLYLAVAPILAALGGALTGSNAASNALFMPVQIEAAKSLGLSETLTAAVQNVAGSHASLLAPQRLILAATATGLLGREGEILRSALPPVLVSLVTLGIVGIIWG